MPDLWTRELKLMPTRVALIWWLFLSSVGLLLGIYMVLYGAILSVGDTIDWLATASVDWHTVNTEWPGDTWLGLRKLVGWMPVGLVMVPIGGMVIAGGVSMLSDLRRSYRELKR